MFDILGLIIEGFIYLWILIIATIPNVFMAGLTNCIGATLLTYVVRNDRVQ